MADNKKYYYMRLKENFFDSDEMVILESMQDGYLYSNILLKLYLKSLKSDGRLMFNESIPYNANMIASVTRQQVGTVERALKVFVEMGFIEVLDNGAIYISQIQHFIGQTSTEADRIRKFERKKREEKNNLLSIHEKEISVEIYEKSTPKIEKEKELEKELEKDIEKEKKIKKEKMTFESLLEEFTDNVDVKESLKYFLAMRKKEKSFTLRAFELALKNLLKLSQEYFGNVIPTEEQMLEIQIKIIDRSVENGWKSFYQLNGKSYKSNKGTRDTSW